MRLSHYVGAILSAVNAAEDVCAISAVRRTDVITSIVATTAVMKFAYLVSHRIMSKIFLPTSNFAYQPVTT